MSWLLPNFWAGNATDRLSVSPFPTASRLNVNYCCNLSGGVALIVWFTTNGMCAKNKNIYAWCEQAIIEWSRRVISIVACCHGAKLCAHAARDFRSQQYATTAELADVGQQSSDDNTGKNIQRGRHSSVVKCPPLNWKVGCSIHSHWVNCCVSWARAFTSTAPARSTIQVSACRQLPSPKLTKKKYSAASDGEENTVSQRLSVNKLTGCDENPRDLYATDC